MKIVFKKLINRWFCDLPEWNGDIMDLEMVMGADDLLDKSPVKSHKDIREVEVVTSDNIYGELAGYDCSLTKYSQNVESGAYYKADSDFYDKDVWLCDVTKSVFGDFPKKIYFKFLN